MFWDRVAFVYDIFADVINAKTHRSLCRVVADEIEEDDNVLECACGTGMLTKAVAGRCRSLRAEDFSSAMIKKARKNCSEFHNITFREGNILDIDAADESFDKVIAGNVIHLLDEPYRALRELDRVCRTGGEIIIPTYMNRSGKGRTSGFAEAVGKAGADFKRQFTFESYQDFFAAAGAGAPESSDKRIAAGMCAGGAVCGAFAGLLLKGYKKTDAD